MNNNFNQRKFISEDEGAGNAAPLIEIFSSLFLIFLISWYLFESFKINIPDNNILTAPSLLPIIFSISILLMLVLILKKGIRGLRLSKNISQFKSITYIKNLISPVILFLYIFSLTNISFTYDLNILNLSLKVGPFLIFTFIFTTLLLLIYWKAKIINCAITSLAWSIFLSFSFTNFFNIPLPGS